MKESKFSRLKQFRIEQPCSENWDQMQGDEQKRFCAGCGCFVNNLSAMTAEQAETVLANPGRVCVRSTSDPKRGILTRDGWIPRLLLVGAIATVAAGCETNTGEAIGTEPSVVQKSTQESVNLGSIAPQIPPNVQPADHTIGKIKVEPGPKRSKNMPKK